MDGRGYPYSYNPYSYYPTMPYSQGEYSQQVKHQFSEPSTSAGQSSEASSDSISGSISSSNTSSKKSSETPKSTAAKKKNYERWTKDEEKMLVRLWADKHDILESKEARKVSGGHRRESPYFKEIDAVTLNHVSDLEAGAASATTSSSHTASDNDDSDGVDIYKTKESRTERKKSKKRQKVEAKDDEEREMLKSSLEGLNEQRKNTNAFMDNFTKMQEQQSQTMNALVGALTGFLQNNSK